MKRVLAAFVVATSIAALVPGAALAQDIGVKAGAVMTKLDGETTGSRFPGLEFDSRAGMLFGVMLIADLSDTLALQIEGSYLQRRAETSSGNALNMDYFFAPVMLKLHLAREFNTPFVMAGLSFSARLDVDLDRKESFIDPIDIGVEMHKTDFGLIVGAGYEFEFGDDRLTIDGRYNHGLKNQFLDVKQVDYKWREFGVTIGYIF